MQEEHTAQSITDLLGRTRYLSPKKGKPLDERASLIKWFADTFNLNPVRLAIKMSHIKNIDDLYYLQSDTKDIINRKGLTSARKAMYARIRTKKIVFPAGQMVTFAPIDEETKTAPSDGSC